MVHWDYGHIRGRFGNPRSLGPLAGLLLLSAQLPGATPSYYRDIRPILQRQCQGCHQPNLKSSNLDVTTFAALTAGGKRGSTVNHNSPSDSLLIKYVTGEMKPQMPMGQTALPAEQVDLLRQWIAAGAKDDSPPEAVDSGKPTLYVQPPVLTALAFSPDGRLLAVSGNREVLIHTLDGSRPVKRLMGLSERILSLAFSRDGKTLLAGGGTPARFGELQVWDIDSGQLRRSITLTGDTVFGASLSPDGTKIATGCADNTVRLVDAETGNELHKIVNHENWVLGTVFGVDGKRVVTVSRDRAAKLTDTASGAFLENVNLLRGELTAVARHPSKDIVVVGGEDRIPYIYLMDRPKNMKIADDTTLVRKLERQNGAIASMAWSPDGKRIAVAGAAPEINLYDAETGARIASCVGHTAGIYSVSFSPDSGTLAAGGFDGEVRIYNSTTGEAKRAFIPVPLQSQDARSLRSSQ
jgi:WD40 repeat protein